ncbi:MAG TPA: ATP-binding protein [Cryomorphaceae bacterium]|nr:ATP-binding protein [Cryomorphaceae bacterium]
MNSSRNKIFVIILILGATSFGFFYWSYLSYNEVKNSLNRLAAANEEAVALNAIFRNLVEAESDFNSYIITDKEDFLASYEAKMQNIDSSLVVLDSLMKSDVEQLGSLDSLKRVIDRKAEYLQLLYQLKGTQRSNVFSKRALDRIEHQLGDSAYVERELLQRRELKADLDTIEQKQTVLTPVEQEGIKGFFNRILGKEKMRVDTVTSLREKVDYSIQLSVDTNIVREYVADSTLSAVKGILLDVLVEELTVQNRLKSTELNLIEQDREFFDNIKRIIRVIVAEEELQNQARRERALSNVSNLTERVYLIGGVGVLLSALFLFLLLRDLTNAGHYRKRLEAEKAKAEQLAKEKEGFLAKMSHEIRTPLHNIIGFSDLLSTPELTPIQQKYLAGIRQSNVYLKELIDNILENAKLNSDKSDLEKSEVFIPSVAQEIEQVFEYKFLDKSVDFLVEVDPQLRQLNLFLDVLKLKQVLVNLIGNALKFTETGHVKLSFGFAYVDDSGQCIVKVEDTGQGIGEEEKEKVFEQFGQGSSGQSMSLTGTGLGLYITSEIVKKFRGSLDLESTPGKGTVFTFRFPVEYALREEQEEVSAETSEVLEKESDHFEMDVIAVEDDLWNARLLEASLIKHVRSFRVMDSAEKAIDYFAKGGKADVIFTDINLPGMNGRELLDRLREMGISAPVVAVSAHIRQTAQREILEAGFDSVCFKPFTKDEILSVLFTLAEAADHAEAGVNVKYFRLFAGDDQKEFEDILEYFHEGLIQKVLEFKEALSRRDISALEDVCHRMKTAAEQVARKDLSESLGGLEIMAEMKNEDRAWEEGARILPQIEELEKAVGKIKRRYRNP